jgi:tetratricopeptide (TPR) repeat protein
MAIPDPHAIPETEADVTEYLHEADAAWDGGDADRAYLLYHGVGTSRLANHDQLSKASYRLALILHGRGEHDLALGYLLNSHEPGTDDLRRSIDNLTKDDPAPDPNVVPTTIEQAIDWLDAAKKARDAGDWAKAAGLFVAVAHFTDVSPAMVASAELRAAEALHHLGRDDEAREWAEKALPNLSGTEFIQQTLDLLKKLGVQVAADHSTAAAEQFADGKRAYESGDAAGARKAFEAALHLDGPAEVKGSARYYLGAMDYQAKHYAAARNHVEAAVSTAAEPERAWAEAMLKWRWDEEVPEPAPAGEGGH